MTTRNINFLIDSIKNSGITIYDPVEVGSHLWLTSPELEILLNDALCGVDLERLPLRTRSKFVNKLICQALGYPIPKSFKKTKPRFPGQFFDKYIQKSNNLQIWNDELSPLRRYVLIKVSDNDLIVRVKVVAGDTLALLDTTGTLTQKYQAKLSVGDNPTELVVDYDTANILSLQRVKEKRAIFLQSPIDNPSSGNLLSIQELYARLRVLVGQSFQDTGKLRERNRGAELHKLVCQALGYAIYRDDGRFPDVKHQLLEVKFQTSPTIDLGLVRPDSQDVLDMPQINGRKIRHCDVRYAIFFGARISNTITISNFILVTGEMFFSRFTQFQGRILNKKLQIPLPNDFFI